MTRASCMSGPGILDLNRVDDADDRGVDGAVLHSRGHASGTAAHDEYGFAESRIDRIHRDQVITLGLPVGIDRTRNEQLVGDEPLILARRDDGPHDLRNDHFVAAFALPIGSASSRLAWGRGITWTDTSSPTRRAAAAPASVAAFTAATSPRTIAVT